MKILTVVGARPQFIKAAPVSFALRDSGHTEFLVHTGQHYDHGMSQVFFDELGIPEPDVNLGVGSGSHGLQTGRMLIALEKVIDEQKPDCVLVYGDTNSTLAGALAAAKLHVPVAHVEAGLRSFNRQMPEEHNRVLTDHCADLLFCPTQTAVNNLANEGIADGVHLVGDTMYDAVLRFTDIAKERSDILDRLGLQPSSYLLATVHRPYNTDNPEALRNILEALAEAGAPVVFPVHPRTLGKIHKFDLLELLQYRRENNSTVAQGSLPHVLLIEPVGYLDMLMLQSNARLIITDSGGMQKEAYFHKVPCITIRPETEWVETVEAGWNVLTQTNKHAILDALNRSFSTNEMENEIFGEGQASQAIMYHLLF